MGETQCEHGSLQGACPLCEANAEIAALRAKVEQLRAYLQDSIRAETSGDIFLVKKHDLYWGIQLPGLGGTAIVEHWPAEPDVLLAAFVRTSWPAWAMPQFIKLAERWMAAFGAYGAEPDGIAIIAVERRKHINHAGWNPPSDNGELAIAAACYARAHNVDEPPAEWPWPKGWWKPAPDDRIRELAKAGALIAAEIDRIKRMKGA